VDGNTGLDTCVQNCAGECNGDGVDLDDDGICDDIDDCVVENGVSQECGCNTGISLGACDCEGNINDECGVCDGDSACIAELGISYLASNNMTVTLNSLIVTANIGSYEYYINYTLENNTTDQAIDEGSFKMYYQNESGGGPQYGSFNSLFPGASLTRSYTFEELHSKPFGELSLSP